jgi:hypothetical protein
VVADTLQGDHPGFAAWRSRDSYAGDGALGGVGPAASLLSGGRL